MFDNVVRLIGFVGSDAQLRTTKTQREFTVLSLATTGVVERQERRRLRPANRGA
jgi:single-stranded DNA-binding protein